MTPCAVYLLRSSVSTLSKALFSTDTTAVVISLENVLLPGKVLSAPSDAPFAEGERLSYERILALVVGDTKILTL